MKALCFCLLGLLLSGPSAYAVYLTWYVDTGSLMAMDCFRYLQEDDYEAIAQIQVDHFGIDQRYTGYESGSCDALTYSNYVFDNLERNYGYVLGLFFYIVYRGDDYAFEFEYVLDPPVLIDPEADFQILPPIRDLYSEGCHAESAAAEETPVPFYLATARPNPSNGSTILEYSLAATEHIRLAVYDLQGRLMSVIHEGLQDAGVHSAHVNMDNWPSGMYLCRLQGGQQVASRRLVLVR